MHIVTHYQNKRIYNGLLFGTTFAEFDTIFKDTHIPSKVD